MSNRLAFAALLLAAAPQVAAAQAQQRILEVPVSAAWKHAATGMILPPRAAGLSRGAIGDRTGAEQDVIADYGGEDGLVTTIYLFETPIADPAIWMDRALTAIQLQPDYGLGAGALPAPVPFQRPGAAAASGLIATMQLSGPTLTGTGVAVVPLGGWLLKVRMTSTRLDAAALEARLRAFVAALRWPAETRALPAAAPIVPCPDALSFKKAKIVPSDMSDMLLAAVSGSVEAGQVEEGKEKAAVFCRESRPPGQFGVYRPNASKTGYLIALGDAGTAIRVAPALTLDMLTSSASGGKRVAMTLLEHDRTTVLPSFNRLPSPEQAVAAAFDPRNRGTLSITTTGKPKPE